MLSELRKKAEDRLKSKGGTSEQMSNEDIQKLIHELQVHQIELEMQNEELRIAQARVEESHNRYIDLYDFAPVGYLTFDENGFVLEANLTASGQLGVERRRFINTPFSLYIAMADRPLFRSHLDAVSRTAEPRSCEVRLITSDGGDFYGQLDTVLVQDASGNKSFRTSITDVTSRKREVLVRRKLAAIVESSDDAIISWTLDGVITSWNRGAEVIYGYTATEAVGQSVSLLIPSDPPDELANVIEKISRGERILHYEAIRLRKGGSKINVSLSIAPITDENGAVCGASTIARDITERKKDEEELLKVKKLEAVGILAGGIAHDFNNLLVVIAGNIQMAQMDLEGDSGIHQRLDNAIEAVFHAKDLAQEFLTFSTGGVSFKTTVSLRGLITESVRLALSGSNVECEYSLPDDLWQVEVDYDQIGQVIRNVVLNAREAMPQGGVITIHANNVVIDSNMKNIGRPERGGRYVTVSIRDQGVGIPKENMDKIFDPYFSTKERGCEKGMGLGLAVAHSIIKRHHGYIRAESEEGSGTTLHVGLRALETVKS